MFIYTLLFFSAADDAQDAACISEAGILSSMGNCYGEDSDEANKRVNWIRENWWVFGKCRDISLEINKDRDDVNGCRKFCADSKKAHDDENPKECWSNRDCRRFDTSEGRAWCVMKGGKGTCKVRDRVGSTGHPLPPPTTTSAPYTPAPNPQDATCIIEAGIFSNMDNCYGKDSDEANDRVNWIRENWWAFGICRDISLEINKDRDDVNGCRKFCADSKKAHDDENPTGASLEGRATPMAPGATV